MNGTLLGWLILGLPLLILGLYLFWRRWRTVFWMYVGALLLGFGYLTATGAMHDIGSTFVGGEKVVEPEAVSDPAPPAPTEPAPAQ